MRSTGRSTTVLLLLAVALASAWLAGPAAARPLAAQENGGAASEGALFLLLPVGPKAVALGRAVTALPGAESVWWNPAGLGGLTSGSFLVYRGESLGGDATAASALFPREGVGTLGFSYQLLDLGSIDQTDEFGNVTGTVAFREHLGVLSLASVLASRVNVGINLKLVQDRFSCRGQCTDGGVTGTTVAVDGGVQVHSVAGLPVRLAALVAHAGPGLQLENEEQADPLPTRVRMAAAWEVLESFVGSDALDLWLAAEVEDRWGDFGDPAVYTGMEFAAGRTQDVALFLRAGYAFGAALQVDGASVGLGLRYESFDLGIAKSLTGSTVADGGEPVHVSFGFVF